MKKKLLVLFFALILTLSVFTMAANAAGEVSLIAIENLRSPLAGNLPDYNIDYVSGSLVSKQYIDSPELINGTTLINGIAWYEVKQTGVGSKPVERVMNKNEVFELGKKYSVRIFVMPNNSNTVFANAVTAKIHELNSDTVGMTAKSATVVTPTGNTNSQYKVVTATYECTKSAIATVEITGLKLPKLGEHPDNDCNVLTEGVYVSSAGGKVEWYYNGRKMDPATDTFEAGKTYKMFIMLRTEFADGYWFKKDHLDENVAEVLINGIPFDVCDTYEYDHVRNVEYEFYVPYNAIRYIDIVGIDRPVAGFLPDYDAVPTTSGYDIVGLFWVDETSKADLLAGGATYSEAFNQSKLVKGDGKTFKAGHEYSVSIEVQPQDDYEIDYNPMDYDILDFAATVNGNDAKEGSGYRGENAGFSYNFGKPALQSVTYIDIIGVDNPTVGKTPDFDAVCSADSYIIKDIFWTDETLKASLIEKGAAYVEAVNQSMLIKGDGKAFVAGHKYSVHFEVEPTENYEIDYNPFDCDVLYFNATVNGADAKEGSGYRGENAGFSYIFEHTWSNQFTVDQRPTYAQEGTKSIHCTISDCPEKTDSTSVDILKLSAPLNLKASKGSRSITLSWDKVTDATGYRVFQYNSATKKWDSIKTTAATAHTVKGLNFNSTYYYIVKAYVIEEENVIWGENSATLKTATTSGITDKITATQSAAAIKLTWNKVADAAGYRVYQYNAATKKWVAIKTTTATTYTVKGLNSGSVYYYLVRAYFNENGKVIWGANSATFKTVTAPGVTAKIVATQSTGTIKLAWSKVAGATGYRVYQYNASTKKWVAIKTTAANTYTVTGLKAGTTYYYLVKAYTSFGGQVIWGANSATYKTSTKTVTPALKVVSTKKGAATLAWSNVAGETGFQVYYSTQKNSGYKLYKNYAANSTGTVISGLQSGRTYYFTVRTYVKTPNGYVFSAWSPFTGVKVK